MKRIIVAALVFFIGMQAAAQTMEEPPEGALSDYGLEELDRETLARLMQQGAVVIVRQKKDLSLRNVTVGRMVEAPMQVVWDAITDYESYPQFMTRTKEQRIIDKKSENLLVVEQTVGVKIWRLPTIKSRNTLVQKLYPPDKVRFWHVAGLKGTYGGWDLVQAGDRTMVFYTLFSNLTSLGWGLGNLFEAEPEFMTGINTTTAMLISKCIKEESERRASK